MGYYSSYPTSMIAFKEYPMSSSQYFPDCRIIKHSAKVSNTMLVFLILRFIGIEPKVWADNPISVYPNAGISKTNHQQRARCGC